LVKISKSIIVLLALFFGLNSCGGTMKKFEYLASESAPKGFPMKIVDGYLLFPNDSGSLYIPYGKTIDPGWGEPVSTHVVGEDFKPLPDGLRVLYFSYLEDAFYAGEFDLPYDEILRLFSEGYYDYFQNEHITYGRIVTGVAPGGLINVWLRGIGGRQVLVFTGKTEKVEVPWTRIIDNPDISRSDFIKMVLEEAIGKETMEHIRKEGIPFKRWETYNKRHQWQPVLQIVDAPNMISLVSYFNGEMGPLPNGTLDKKADLLPIPAKLEFYRRTSPSSVVSVELSFDEREIFSAFTRLLPLVSESRSIALLVSSKQQASNDYTVILTCGDEKVVLNQVKTAMSGSGLGKEFIKSLWNN
ncbi:MAG TPA: DUF2931 family protein, partial [Cyclobacteriaceae bacterium]|nr:DUF2931 family protein [Cyclobacteriaceae bacterium]